MAAPHVDMRGKRVLITGFTAGIGRAAARELAAMGAELVLVCRSADKGEATMRAIRGRVPDARLEMLVGDLGRQADIHRIAEAFLQSDRTLDVLFNNAGVIIDRRTTTGDGYETTFAVNHLGYFLLTHLLREPLRAAGGGRVVSTASDAHKFNRGRLRLDDLQSEQRYTAMRTYGASKLANILFTRELARREREHGVTANAFHPGFVASGFAHNNGTLARIVMTGLSPFARSSEKGAQTGVFLCTSPSVAQTTGEYFQDMKPRLPARAAQHDGDAARLWELSESLTGTAG